MQEFKSLVDFTAAKYLFFRRCNSDQVLFEISFNILHFPLTTLSIDIAILIHYHLEVIYNRFVSKISHVMPINLFLLCHSLVSIL